MVKQYSQTDEISPYLALDATTRSALSVKIKIIIIINNNNNNNNNNNRTERRSLRFFIISSPRHESSPTRTVRSSGPGAIVCKSGATSSAYHVQQVVISATWYEGTAQLLSLTEFKSHLFELYFIG